VVARIPGRVYRVLWSPDGLRIAVPTSNIRISVVTVRTRRSRLVRLGARTRFTIVEGWSPDGKELLVAATVPTGTFLAAIAISNGRRRQISPIFPYGYSGSPEASWSPDGSSIAFTDDCQDVCESLHVVSAHGGQPRKLKVVGGSVHAPVWVSPPGTLAYIDDVGVSNNEAVYLVNTRTGRRRRLSPPYGGLGLDSLTPSADRSRIAAIYTLHGTRVDIIDIASSRIRHSRIPHACCIQVAGPAT
jgi:Tol biopolymer transport system component